MSVTMRVDAADLEDVIRKYDSIGKGVKRVDKRHFRQAARPYILAMKIRAPRAGQVVKRYNTPKLSGKIRAPKGSGVVVATYSPGNLGKSFADLRLRRVKKAIVIGPNARRKNIADGYYARFVEDKKPFAKAIWSASRPIVLRRLVKIYQKRINEAIR